eukprot:jgi/Botrbrau1/6655/Bobra.0202s0003.1
MVLKCLSRPDFESRFHRHIHNIRSRGDFLAMAIATIALSFFVSRMDLEGSSFPGTVRCLVLGVFAMVGLWFGARILRPAWLGDRRQYTRYVSACVHACFLLVASLGYGNRHAPPSLLSALPVILSTCRSLQQLVGIGLWDTIGGGLTCHLAFLTGILFFTFHWNKGDCIIMAHKNPALFAHYLAFQGKLRGYLWLPPAETNVLRCVQTRIAIQVTLGTILPLVLCVWRELAERRAYAKSQGVTLVWAPPSELALSAFASLGIVTGTAGVLFLLLTGVPELEDLPLHVLGLKPQ